MGVCPFKPYCCKYRREKIIKKLRKEVKREYNVEVEKRCVPIVRCDNTTSRGGKDMRGEERIQGMRKEV